MAEVKGVLITAMRGFLVDRYGKSAIDQALATLDPKEVSLIQKRFLESSFYPYATMAAMASLFHALSGIRRTTGEELGKSLAEYVFQGPYKPMLTHDVVRMVEKIGPIKGFFYRDANSIESVMTGGSSCKIVYRYEKGVLSTRGACRSLGAFWGRVIELAGGMTVTATHPICVAEGKDRCEFKYSW